MAEKQQEMSRARTLDRLSSEMNRLYDVFGVGRGWLPDRQHAERAAFGADFWAPQIEVVHRNNELVLRADLPGLSRDDVEVVVTGEAVIIQGERRQTHEERRDGFYRTERTYGSFYRMFPLPEEAMVDQAKATFKDGVLEVRMPAPPQSAKQGRRIEISQAT